MSWFQRGYKKNDFNGVFRVCKIICETSAADFRLGMSHCTKQDDGTLG